MILYKTINTMARSTYGDADVFDIVAEVLPRETLALIY